ncbi:MAG: hypothetical protein R3F59_36560 [Myxococcota bacterium]
MLVLTKVVALRPWGRLVDRRGPLVVYRLAALGVGDGADPWIFADRAWIVFMSGGRVGHRLGRARWRCSPWPSAPWGRAGGRVLLTAQSLGNGGVAQVVGGLGAAGLASAGGSHAVAFGASAAVRVCVALAAPLALGPASRVEVECGAWARGSWEWMPSGGLVRQLIGGASDREAGRDGVTLVRQLARLASAGAGVLLRPRSTAAGGAESQPRTA